MIKDQLDWEIGERNVMTYLESFRIVKISGVEHKVNDQTACIAHCLLLLIDSINDSKIGQPS